MIYQYNYLICALGLFVIWILLFYFRKDVRKEMWIISILFGFAGLFVEGVYTSDWWHPQTITNTKIGIEDFLFSFGFGGIASVIYEELFKKKIKIKKSSKKRILRQNKIFIFILSSLAILFFGSFYILGLSSFYSSVIGFTLPTLFIWIKRKDLMINSVVSGIILMLMAFLIFVLVEYITPGWIDSAWYLDFSNFYDVLIIKAPLKELIWFFLAGSYIGPLYEFWKESKLINIKK